MKGRVNHWVLLVRMAILVSQRDYIRCVVWAEEDGQQDVNKWKHDCNGGWAVPKFCLCKSPLFCISEFSAQHKINFCFTSLEEKLDLEEVRVAAVRVRQKWRRSNDKTDFVCWFNEILIIWFIHTIAWVSNTCIYITYHSVGWSCRMHWLHLCRVIRPLLHPIRPLVGHR